MAFADTLISVMRLTFHSKIPRICKNFAKLTARKKIQIKMDLKFFLTFEIVLNFLNNLFIRHTSQNTRMKSSKNSPTSKQTVIQ